MSDIMSYILIIATSILAVLFIVHIKERNNPISENDKYGHQKEKSSITAVLDITVDIQCHIAIDGEIVDIINPGESKKLTLPVNKSYLLMFMSTYHVPYHEFRSVDLIGDMKLNVNFLNKINEKDLIYIKEEKCFRNLNRGIDITCKIYDEGEPFLTDLPK